MKNIKIPKILHYVWLGGKKPKLIQDIILNWKTILGSEWIIKEWNETNFDIETHKFTKHHYKRKNWAFVSDYIRAYAVYQEGGFYFDTDIQLFKTLDTFLNNDFVASRIWGINLTASSFGSIPKSKILKDYLNAYNNWFIKITQPKIMSSQIMSVAVYNSYKYSMTKNTETKDGILILNENVLQVITNKKDSIAVHLHHDNWKGKKDNLNDNSFYLKKQRIAKEPLSKKRIIKSKKELMKNSKTINKFISKKQNQTFN